MQVNEQEDSMTYEVVVNDNEQYSIWPVQKTLPAGWHLQGKQGIKSECLAHIDTVWTDMRPLSLRRKMAEHGL